MRSILAAISIATIFLLVSTTIFAAPDKGKPRFEPRMFGKGHAFDIRDLPRGRIPDRIEALPWQARQRAMRWLHRFKFPAADLESMEIDERGAVRYIEPIPDLPQLTPEQEQASSASSTIPGLAALVDDAFLLHSRPGAPHVVYLDFDGQEISGTAWNSSHDPLYAKAFDLDGNPSTFNDAERTAIAEIWHRVAEDFAAFDIDVTTEEPSSFNAHTGRVLITSEFDANGTAMPSNSGGGVAYVGVWGRSDYASLYSPALVYYDNLSSRANYIAEASSHEFGHNLGLSHDGSSSTNYYRGHGTGDTSWAPIMGSSFSKNVTQWSKGEYADANNTQDDIAVVADALSLAADDHGDNRSTATALAVDGNGHVLVSDPETDPHNVYPENKGIIEAVDDWDYFSFYSADGAVEFTITPSWQAFYRDSRRGGNLDVRAVLLDSNGNVLAESDPTSKTDATISITVSEGTHFLAITGVGSSNYSSYASQGQYFISGSLVSAPNAPPSAGFSSACQTLSCSFLDSSTDSDGSIASWSWSFGDGASSTAQSPSHSYADDGSYPVTLTVTDDDGASDTTSQTVTVSSGGGSTSTELIVDNQDANTERTGTWKNSSGASPWAGQSVYNDSGSVFRWLPAITESGRYQVYAWWTYHGNRSDSVPYRVGHDGGVSTVIVNQRDPALGGQWVLLGEYDFAEGTGSVEVSSENGQASADAVRLVKSGDSNLAPTAGFDSTCELLACAFFDDSNDSDGSIVSWSWDFGDGAASTAQSPSHSYAADGSYTVTLTVTDNDGASDITNQTVTVSSGGGSMGTELIVDNQDANTEKTGTWTTSSGANPWAGQSVYNDSDSVFRWLPVITEGGLYEVYAWWTYHGNRSDSVPYRIGHDGGVATVMVNQNNPAQAGRWVPLGEYNFAAGTGYVEVSSENGQASADAVRLVKSVELVVDNQDANTERTGTWAASSGANPWAGQSVYNNSDSIFRWLPTITEGGSYLVYAWWTYHGNRSDSVPYRIGHNGGVATVTVNQNDPAQAGQWVLLGEYDFAAGTGYVEVSSENGQASADAVRLLRGNGS